MTSLRSNINGYLLPTLVTSVSAYPYGHGKTEVIIAPAEDTMVFSIL